MTANSEYIPEKRKVSIKLRKWIEFHDRLQIAFDCLRARKFLFIYLSRA